MAATYIFSGILIVTALSSLVKILYNISKQAEKDLLEKMFKNGDINTNVYVKYASKD